MLAIWHFSFLCACCQRRLDLCGRAQSESRAYAMTFRIGLLLFPDITQLDLTGPYEVFTKFPEAEVRLIWKTLEPIKAGGGMRIVPDTTFAD
jgi:hypothetical protein